MATRSAQAPSLTGFALTKHAADAAGDQVPTGRIILLVNNAGTAAVTLTIVTPGQVNGLAIADLAVSVPAGADDFIVGPLDAGLFGDATTTRASLTWSAVASVTFSVVAL